MVLKHLDMLQSMNTGHDGSLATGHSNSPRDMISRLETMVLLGGIDLPVRAIRDQISGALDLIIQQSRLKDGSRRIVKVTEVQGLEGDIITLQDIFEYQQKGVDEDGKIIGEMVPTGVRPKFYERLESSGIYIPPHVFIRERDVMNVNGITIATNSNNINPLFLCAVCPLIPEKETYGRQGKRIYFW